MTEIKDQGKDFLALWMEDFVPTVFAVCEAIEPYVRAFSYVANKELNKELNQFLEEHQTIKVWLEFAYVYPKIQPYVDNMAKGLNDPDFEVANDVILLSHLFDAIDLEQDPNSASILTVISSEAFQKSITDFYSNISLNSLRLPFIEEALSLHSQGYYAGSISILYELIEGVLTEAFEKAKYIRNTSKGIKPVSPNGEVLKNKRLVGLVPKLDHAITHEDSLEAYYEKLKTYQLVSGDSDQTIPKTRNKILHGDSLDFNTEKNSAQLIVWLYSVVLRVSALVAKGV